MSKKLFCGLIVAAIGSAAISGRAATYSSLVVFGDSISDVGNIYVESGGLLPSFNPGLNPALIFTARRFTDGPDTVPATSLTGVWVEQLAAKLNVTVPTASLAGGTNYAYGGATSGTGTTALGAGLQAENVGTQVGQYLGSKAVDPNALYIVWAGANDIGGAANAGGTASQVITAATVAEANTKNEVSTLLQAGAKHVLWVSAPPMDLTPDFNALNPEHSAVQQASSAFHTAWQTDLAALEASASGALSGLDAYALLEQVEANPPAFGLTNVTGSAFVDGQTIPGLNPDNYLFWDGEHPTTAGQALLANAALAAVPEPATVALMVMGLAPLLRRRPRGVGGGNWWR